MTDIITLELRQKDASKSVSPGEWYNQMGTNTVLEEGDIVQIDKCFIDTTE